MAVLNTNRIRKSSCVNARGIPQLLTLLLCLLVGRGVPHPIPTGGTPFQSQWEVYPILPNGGGTPIWSMGGTPIRKDGVHPPPGGEGWGIPIRKDKYSLHWEGWGGGYPPGLRCELTNKLKTVPSPILRMRVVKIKRQRGQ